MPLKEAAERWIRFLLEGEKFLEMPYGFYVRDFKSRCTIPDLWASVNPQKSA